MKDLVLDGLDVEQAGELAEKMAQPLGFVG